MRVLDFDRVDGNDWLAVNQFTVAENKRTRRPDVVLFVNGLPLAVAELKNAADEGATIWSAFQQLQTYKAEVPALFATNELLVIFDGVEARVGTLTAGREWFKPWRTIAGQRLADPHVPELQVVSEGLCAPRRFLDLVRDFVVIEDEGGGKLTKKMAGYHQFHAVQVAVSETLRAAELARAGHVAEAAGRYEASAKPGGKPGDHRVGVVWHTQGSGKSLTMAFYAGRIIREPAMENPPIVVLTDGNSAFWSSASCASTATRRTNRSRPRRRFWSRRRCCPGNGRRCRPDTTRAWSTLHRRPTGVTPQESSGRPRWGDPVPESRSPAVPQSRRLFAMSSKTSL